MEHWETPECKDRGAKWGALMSWISNRDTRYVAARGIAEAYFDPGDYASHVRWLAVREQEKDNLNMVPHWLCIWPDYWERLTEWAFEDADLARSRMALVNEHRERIDRITKKRVLPSDFIAETAIGSAHA